MADLHAAERRLHELRKRLPASEWNRRPPAGGWSPAECVAHLNLSSKALLPLWREGLDRARALEPVGSRRYRRDLTGWILWRVVTPSGRFKVKTAPAFVPTGDQPIDVLAVEFERLNGEMAACVLAAEGLAIDRVKIVSPFDARARYNVYAAMTLVPRHEHRHLLQAERAAAA